MCIFLCLFDLYFCDKIKCCCCCERVDFLSDFPAITVKSAANARTKKQSLALFLFKHRRFCVKAGIMLKIFNNLIGITCFFLHMLIFYRFKRLHMVFVQVYRTCFASNFAYRNEIALHYLILFILINPKITDEIS